MNINREQLISRIESHALDILKNLKLKKALNQKTDYLFSLCQERLNFWEFVCIFDNVIHDDIDLLNEMVNTITTKYTTELDAEGLQLETQLKHNQLLLIF